MTTNPQKFTITFTAEEFELRTAMLGDPPVLQLYKRTRGDPQIEGKFFYSALMCQKIGEVVPGKSRFRVASTWKSCKDTKTCYAYCSHNLSAVVSYKEADFGEGRELKFLVEVKCARCLGVSLELDSSSCATPVPCSSVTSELSSPVSIAPSSKHPVPASAQQTQLEMLLLPNSPATKICKQLGEAILEQIAQTLSVCLASEDEMTMLGSKKVELVQSICSTSYNVLAITPSAPPSLVPIAPLRPVPTAFDVLSKAAQDAWEEERKEEEARKQQDENDSDDEPVKKKSKGEKTPARGGAGGAVRGGRGGRGARGGAGGGARGGRHTKK